ncbi:MAG: hybrid sensor histidine kinase/response regulator [Bdellovibrionales bacterium]|jgi:signal transduction histidine kinase|nr:hybrid sensor histidine kinase/response regulator [Bdellovibrionales bacterium]
MKHTILCVDDEVDNVDSLERLFRNKYTVLKATSGAEALKHLDRNRVTIIISDQRMPQMTGVEFLSKSLKTHPDAIRILLTGYADIEVVIEAINNGQVYRYVTKPWDPVDLVNTVDKAVERYELGLELVEKNRALKEALTELQTLDQAKNQFMVLVNHELKTPLTTMLSFADLLAETELDGDQQRYLSRVKGAALRLQEMITDSLELVSAETQQTKLDLKSVAIKQILSDAHVTDSVQRLLKERELSLKFSVENQKIIADERILKGISRRILHNAAKFAEPKSEISVVGNSTGKGTYSIAFENLGPAIDEKKIQNLLKPFTLNENTMNHSVGTGLGLSICNALLKLHSSKLQFKCEGSKPARITVSFELGLDPDSV